MSVLRKDAGRRGAGLAQGPALESLAWRFHRDGEKSLGNVPLTRKGVLSLQYFKTLGEVSSLYQGFRGGGDIVLCLFCIVLMYFYLPYFS